MATFVTNGSMSYQLVLFSEKRWPAGLRYEPAFVSPDEERALVTCLAELPLAPSARSKGSAASLHSAGAMISPAAAPFPSWIVPVVTKVEAFADLPVGAIQHILFTEYEPGRIERESLPRLPLLLPEARRARSTS